MEPNAWARTILDHLEQIPIVGALLPRQTPGELDRYQPSRVHATYAWSGSVGARTEINFLIKSEEPIALNSRHGAFTVRSSASEREWNGRWELIRIELPQGVYENCSQEIHEPNRFRVNVSVLDERADDETSYHRRIIVDNFRELGGILHAIRIIQANLPTLERMRAFGIGEDIYYRAGGLIGTLDRVSNSLTFAPFALLPEPSRTPVRGPSLSAAIQSGLVSEQIAGILRSQGIEHLYQFQADAIGVIGRRLRQDLDRRPILLTSGTASGKTEAFTIPLLEDLREDAPSRGLVALFVYPTRALSADQARRLFEAVFQFNQGRRNKLTLGVLDGDTAWDRSSLRGKELAGQLRTQFSECPSCREIIRFAVDVNGQDIAMPTCSGCQMEFEWLRIDRSDISKHTPNILITTPDMLQRKLTDKFGWAGHCLLGREMHFCTCGQDTPATHNTLRDEKRCSGCNGQLPPASSIAPKVIVFDEAHLLKGLFGSQIAMLIARIQKIAQTYGHSPQFVGASATIASPVEFGRQLFGSEVEIIEGRDIIDNSLPPRRYHLFIIPVGVTVLYAIGNVLAGIFRADSYANERNKVLVFSDSKTTVYQLQSTLPEFYANIDDIVLPHGLDDAPTASHTGDLSRERRLAVERAFDQGLIRVLLATQTLEVGVDFENLQLEIQAGGTYSYNDYIQRVGRAGRRGVEALVICVLRPHVPLDYYYFEHCRELVEFSPETLDDIPIRADNPFLVERHCPAAVQDFLISAEPGARLTWSLAAAVSCLEERREEILDYLRDVFVRPHSWDGDLIEDALRRGYERAVAAVGASGSSRFTSDRLSTLIQLTVRAADVQAAIEADDFELHHGISMAGDIDADMGIDVEEAETDREDAEAP